MKYKCVAIYKEYGGWRATVEWSSGFLWWRKTHQGDVFSYSGDIWVWSDHRTFDVSGCSPNPANVISFLKPRPWKEEWTGEELYWGV